VIPFHPTDKSLFFTKNDPDDPRVGELIESCRSLETLSEANGFAVLGYSDDEGIALNGGRIGASEAPDTIRRFLYRMTPPSAANNKAYDLGNLLTEGSLAERHARALQVMEQLQRKSLRTISFGGGHDYGYPDCAGFVRAHLDQKPLVINFDAHLDVRPSDKGLNSGTPFYRLLSEFGRNFQFVEVGLQPQCNSLRHRQWALSQGASLFDLNCVENRESLLSILESEPFRQLTSQTPVYISFDIDGLKSAEAPGCSQSWATGLATSDYLAFFHELKKKCALRGLGIYEVSPPLDTGHITSKTAALIAYHFLFQDQL